MKEIVLEQYPLSELGEQYDLESISRAYEANPLFAHYIDNGNQVTTVFEPEVLDECYIER